jgi:hypothetical protein
MKIPEEYKMLEAYDSKSLKDIKCLKHIIQNPNLQRSLYELKQSGHMWYNRPSEYLLKEEFENNQICPCVFIKRLESGFAIVAVYVDDLNLVGTLEEFIKTANYLNNEFEMKDLDKTKFCLDLQIEHISNEILVHQSAYTEKVLKTFRWIKLIF